jgi:hypothetical protein
MTLSYAMEVSKPLTFCNVLDTRTAVNVFHHTSIRMLKSVRIRGRALV